jgi:hypothetical protein
MKYLYCLYTYSTAGLFPPKLPAFKIGISGSVQDRMRQIESELSYTTGKRVTIRKALAMPLLFSGFMERRLHRALSAIRAKMPYHAGHTEWFRCVNFGAAVIYLLLLAAFRQDMNYARVGIFAVVVLAPFPVDGFVLVLVSFLADVAVFFLILYSVIWLASTLWFIL